MKRTIQYALSAAATVIFIVGSGHVKAQESKEVRRIIVITDGDTVINGKKLSEASASDRRALLKELDEAKANRKSVQKKKGVREKKEVYIERSDREPHVLRWRSDDEGEGMNFRFKDDGMHVFKFGGDSLMMAFGNDSLMKRFHFKMDDLDSNMRKRVFSFDHNMRGLPRMLERSHPRIFMDGTEAFGRSTFRRENSQSFNYVSTDKDGISSRVSIRISEADEEALKKINAGSGTELAVNDLTLSPNFSNGKMNLSFSLTEKGTAQIRIFDSSMKEIFSDRPAAINSIYFKQISLPKNGIYYISISQGSKAFVRKVVKE
jgi:hypothetical protein